MDTQPGHKKRNNNNREQVKGTPRSRGSSRNAARVSSGVKRKKRSQTGYSTLRKKPRQPRSKQMVEAILQAASEVFAKLGYAGATTNKIAERAGVSVGSLYQYYPNKDSLLASLLAEHHAEVHDVIDNSLVRLADPATPLDDCLSHFFKELVALHQAKPDLTKALSAAVLRESSQASHHKEGDDADRAAAVIAVLANRPDVRKGNYVAMAAVLGQAVSQLSRWLVHDPPSGIDPSSLEEEVVRMLVCYLQKMTTP